MGSLTCCGPPGGAVQIGRVYEGTHKGCPYGWMGKVGEGSGGAYEGTHKGCPYKGKEGERQWWRVRGHP